MQAKAHLMADDLVTNRPKRANPPLMGALAFDQNAAQSRVNNRPVGEGVRAGVAGPAVDNFREGQVENALAGVTLPKGAAQPASTPAVTPPSPADAAKQADATIKDPTRPTFGNVGAGSAATATPATSVGGRPLGYGATIDGVRTFSDGTAGVPATMTRPQIDALAAGSNLTRADSGVGGNIGSEALGGMPVLGGFGALTRPNVDAYARAKADQIGAAMDAQSDLRSILTRDPRSALGSAMRNLDVEAGSYTPRPGANARTEAAIINSVAAPFASATKLGETSLQDAGATERQRISTAGQLEGDRIRAADRNPQTIDLADGTLGIVRPNGMVSLATDASGNPVRPQVGKPAVDSAAYGKYVESVSSRLLGTDPVTGLLTDRQTGKQRPPTVQEIAGAALGAKELADKIFNAGGAQQNPTKPVNLEDFKARARRYNPNATDQELEDYYKKNYAS